MPPFDPAIHLFAEDMDLCLRARAEGRYALPRRHRGHAYRPPQHPRANRSRHSPGNAATPSGARSGSAHAALDDAAQLLTFATRTLAKDPHNAESAPKWTRSLTS